jgi:hypothetical protein
VIPRISLRQALADPALLGGVLEGESWKPWRTLLLAAMGEELTEDERPVFKKFTGREREPGRRVEEFVGVKGRRAGGSYAGGNCRLVSAPVLGPRRARRPALRGR